MKILGLFIIFPCLLFSQNKNQWFVGGETGLTTIVSANNKNSFQAGLLAEYYFAKQQSIVGRIKYFETGVINNSETEYFEGKIIAVPIDIKWEYRIVKNLKGNLYLGFALNQEIKSDYHYPSNENTNFSKFYGTFNSGIGFTYFFNEKMAVFTNYETYLFGNNRDSKSNTFFIISNSPNNNLFNIGIKYNLKN